MIRTPAINHEEHGEHEEHEEHEGTILLVKGFPFVSFVSLVLKRVVF